jgi:two-component system alkaline phosphatase synthesis response regulator PhoP
VKQVGAPKRKILIVDDERDIVDLISYNLMKEGYEVVPAFDGREALEKAALRPDLVILDLMMPVLDGFDTCRRLKSNPDTADVPVMFLTARSSEVDEVVGLELGADDFIQKPISPRKLIARVKAVFRRAQHPVTETGEHSVIKAGRVQINRTNRTVHLGKKEISFPRKEFDLLAFLAANKGRVYSREMLLNSIWGRDVYVIDRTVDVHIRKIREKLGDDADSLETVKGVGYRFKN